jgi:hypothetical protein
MGTCGVCFDECDRGIMCGRLHSICADCAPREVERVLQGLQEPGPLSAFRGRGGLIKCVQDGCAGTYANSDLLVLLPARTAQLYRREQAHAAQYRAATQARVEGRQHDEAAATAEYLRMHYRNAVQCPSCGAGPVIPENCSDLRTHHGEAAANGGHINNACPSCGYFSRNRADWHRWDGRMRDECDRTNLSTAMQSAPAMRGSDREHQDQLRALMDIAGIDAARARRLLQENSWQLQASANAHFDLASAGERMRRDPCGGMLLVGFFCCVMLGLGLLWIFATATIDARAPPSGSLAYDVPPFVVGARIRLERKPGLISGKPTTCFAARNLPAGFAIDSSTGVISGTALEAINRRIEVFAFTPGIVPLNGPTTRVVLNVAPPVTMGSVLDGTAKAVLSGVGTIAVGSLYWLVTQDD